MIDPPQMSETDAHCHILPGLDDGASCLETSLAIAHLLTAMGVRRVVATPHVMSDVYPTPSEKIREAAAALQGEFRARGIPLEILPAAEYYAEQAFLERIKKGDVLFWGDERYVLFETPLEQEPRALEEIVFRLRVSGYTPLLAHVERYRFAQKDAKFERLGHLRRLGARFQVNHPSFHLPKTSRRGELARKLYIRGWADVLGTDIHKAKMSDSELAHRGDKRLFARLADRP